MSPDTHGTIYNDMRLLGKMDDLKKKENDKGKDDLYAWTSQLHLEWLDHRIDSLNSVHRYALDENDETLHEILFVSDSPVESGASWPDIVYVGRVKSIYQFH